MTYNIIQKFKSLNELIDKLQSVSTARSLSKGIEYTDIMIVNGYIKGKRKSTNNTFSIDINKLYNAINRERVLNTNILKKYITNRAQSPSLAILRTIKVI